MRGKLSLEKESFPRTPFKEIIWDFKGWGFFRGPSGRGGSEVSFCKMPGGNEGTRGGRCGKKEGRIAAAFIRISCF